MNTDFYEIQCFKDVDDMFSETRERLSRIRSKARCIQYKMQLPEVSFDWLVMNPATCHFLS